MGSRTMDKPSASGRTVARRIVPKSVRRRQKRAVRRAAKGQTRVKHAKHPKQKRVRIGAARPRKSAKVAKQRLRKRTVRIVAKAQTLPKHDEKPRTKPIEKPRKKQARRIAGQPPEPPTPTDQVEEEPEIDEDEQEQEPLDYLEDGVVEWGIRRE